ncbi:uncharacterized protein LOC142238066 [Haematobia irritans]|uniref:uncharacterized protein LOC142238066 n=1 Tax=Haematobia irritans TaxID=7368 RepID=UPI003F4F475B
MEKRKYKNKANWSSDAEACLMHVWRDNTSKLRGARKQSHTLHDMAKEMTKFGYQFSKDEIKIKIHNLTNKYRCEKKKVGPSGGTPSSWSWFEEVHAIIGSQSCNNAEELMEDNFTTATMGSENVKWSELEILEDNENEFIFSQTLDQPTVSRAKRARTSSSSSECSSAPCIQKASRRKKKNTYDDVLTVMKNTENILRQECEDRKKIDEELLKIQKEQLYLEKEKNEIERERNAILKNMLL